MQASFDHGRQTLIVVTENPAGTMRIERFVNEDDGMEPFFFTNIVQGKGEVDTTFLDNCRFRFWCFKYCRFLLLKYVKFLSFFVSEKKDESKSFSFSQNLFVISSVEASLPI